MHPTEKFRLLADVAPSELAFEHLYLAFEFYLPVQIILEMQQLSAELRVTALITGVLSEGIVSASLAAWKRLLPLATRKEQSEWLIKTVNGMYVSTFINIPYFNDLKSNPLSPQTFALVKA